MKIKKCPIEYELPNGKGKKVIFCHEDYKACTPEDCRYLDIKKIMEKQK